MVTKTLSFLSCIIGLIGILFESYDFALFFSLASYGLLLYYNLRVVGINSVLFLFLIFFGLYGYSVPISVFFEADIGWHRVAKLSTWQEVDRTLYSYLLSNQLALLAIILLEILFVTKKTMVINRPQNQKRIGENYFFLALVAGIVASLSEALNFIRAGGLTAISNGKAYYQGAVSDLVLNIPYDGFFFISIALFSQFFATADKGIKYIWHLPIYLVSIAFILFVNLSIGERGTLVVAAVIYLIGFTMKKRITRIRISYIFGFALLYVFFNIITLLREDYIEYNGLTPFWEENKERLMKLMNPANTEFAAAALNYRVFSEDNGSDFDLKLGSTYAELPLAFIPVYVYPSKPQSILYKFRDDYFSERKKGGSTAGTGFSSLLEAYMNFGYIGPFVIYMIAVFFLIYLETKRKNDNLYLSLLYLLLFNIFLIFSRSVSQYIFYNLILYCGQALIVVAIYSAIPKKVLKLVNGNNEKK